MGHMAAIGRFAGHGMSVGSWAMRNPLRGLRLDVDYLGIWNEKASDSNFVSLPDSPLAAMSVIV